MEEAAAFASQRPSGWYAERRYAVVRRRTENGQLLLVPRHTVIVVWRDDLPLEELVLRHRAKQGQENTFKGPLIGLGLHYPLCRANQAFHALDHIAQALLRSV